MWRKGLLRKRANRDRLRFDTFGRRSERRVDWQSRREKYPARLSDAAQKFVKRIHRKAGEQSVCMCERRTPDNRNSGARSGQLPSDSCNSFWRHACFPRHRLRRIIREVLSPAINSASSRSSRFALGEMLVQNDMSQGKRDEPFGPRFDPNPLIGVRAGLRHPTLDLHKLSADARPALAHDSVSNVVRDWRIPCAEEVRPEGDHIVRPRNVIRWELVVAETQAVCFPQN